MVAGSVPGFPAGAAAPDALGALDAAAALDDVLAGVPDTPGASGVPDVQAATSAMPAPRQTYENRFAIAPLPFR